MKLSLFWSPAALQAPNLARHEGLSSMSPAVEGKEFHYVSFRVGKKCVSIAFRTSWNQKIPNVLTKYRHDITSISSFYIILTIACFFHHSKFHQPKKNSMVPPRKSDVWHLPTQTPSLWPVAATPGSFEGWGARHYLKPSIVEMS